MNEFRENNNDEGKSVENSCELSARDFFVKKWVEINGLDLDDEEKIDREDYSEIFDKGVEKMVDELGFDLVEEKFTKLKEREDGGEKLKGTDAWNKKHLENSVKITKEWQEKGFTTLSEALDIDNLRDELEDLKQSGDVEKITKKELEIVEQIKRGVGMYPQVEQSEDSAQEDKPSEILKNQEFNCIGASIIGGELLKRAGIKQFPAEVYHHATNVVVSADKSVHITDMRWPKISKKLDQVDIKDADIENILDFTKSNQASLNLNFSDERFSEIKSFWNNQEGVDNRFIIRSEKAGDQVAVLMNYLKELHFKDHRTDAAIEACKYAESLDPDNPSVKEHLKLLEQEQDAGVIEFDPEIMREVFYFVSEEQVSVIQEGLEKKIERDGKKFQSSEEFRNYLNDISERLHNLDYIGEIFEVGDKEKIKEYVEYAGIAPEKAELMEYYAKLRKETIDAAKLELARRELYSPDFDEQDEAIGIYKEKIESHVRGVVYRFNKVGLKTVYSGFDEMVHQSIKFKEDYLQDFQFDKNFLEKMEKRGIAIELEADEIIFETKKKFTLDELKDIWDKIGDEIIKKIPTAAS